MFQWVPCENVVVIAVVEMDNLPTASEMKRDEEHTIRYIVPVFPSDMPQISHHLGLGRGMSKQWQIVSGPPSLVPSRPLKGEKHAQRKMIRRLTPRPTKYGRRGCYVDSYNGKIGSIFCGTPPRQVQRLPKGSVLEGRPEGLNFVEHEGL